MSKDERITQLEARLALVEGRLAALESGNRVYGPITWPTTFPNIVTCDLAKSGTSISVNELNALNNC